MLAIAPFNESKKSLLFDYAFIDILYLCRKVNKMKRIFIIDWWLIFVFAITAYSGFELHIAGHFSTHEVWHNWAVCHTLASLAFIVLGVLHIQTHRGWYKSLISEGIGKKSRITIWLSFIYLIVSITGIVLLSIKGGNTDIGLWHYKMGIVLTIIGVGHFIKRFPILRKSIGK